MPLPTSLKPAERELILFAPFMIFYSVSGVDGKIQAAEMHVLLDAINTKDPSADSVTQAVYETLSTDFSKILAQFQSQKKDWIAMLKELNNVLEWRCPAEAPSFKTGLLLLGMKMAQSCHSDPLPKDDRNVSSKEVIALQMIADALGLDIKKLSL